MTDQVVTRLIVNLTATTDEALERVAAQAGLTRTEVIQKAVQFYDYACRVQATGGWLAVREDPDQLSYQRLDLL